MNQLSENFQRIVDNWEMLLVVAGLVIFSVGIHWLQTGRLRLTSEEVQERDFFS